jgi:hypothetical protein
MKKFLGIIILVIVGIIAAVGLVFGAILEIAEAIIGFVVWSVVIIGGYFFIKAKT